MRTWRKVYATILDSEQVSQVSDGAAFLLTLLIAAQDDTGYWPWTPTKIRRLVASRPTWTLEDAKQFASELVAVDIARWESGGIVLTKGPELNGTPRTDSKPEITPRNEVATPCIESVTPRNEVVPLEQSRVDKSRVDLEQSRLEVSQDAIAPEPPTKKRINKSSLTKKEPNPKIRQVIDGINLAYGDEYPEWKRHVVAIEGLLKKYTVEQIVGCWKDIYQQRGGDFVPLSWLVDRIKAWKDNGGKLAQRGNSNGRAEPRRPRTPNYDDGREPFAATKQFVGMATTKTN